MVLSGSPTFSVSNASTACSPRCIAFTAIRATYRLQFHRDFTFRDATALVLFKEYPHVDVSDRADDLFTVNDLHVPVGKMVLVQLKSQDVLHSFFLPNMRVKQDAVPGMRIPVWFRPMKIGRYDLPCAELCGWGSVTGDPLSRHRR